MFHHSLAFLLALAPLVGCSPAAAPTATPESAPATTTALANPASEFCTDQGYALELRTSDTGVAGYCILPDGGECEEWAFFRGECGPGGERWGPEQLTLTTLESFPVHVRAQVSGVLPGTCATVEQIEQTYDPPSQTFLLSPIVGATETTACLPAQTPFTANVELEVAGLGAGTYTVTVGNLSETFTFCRANRLPDEGTGPAAMADLADWSRFSHPTYGFSLRYPPDWVATETLDPAHTLAGHLLILAPADDPEIAFAIAYRLAEDELRLARNGMGAGELLAAGSLPFLGDDVQKSVLLSGSKTLGVYYDGATEIRRGRLVFTLALDYRGDVQIGRGICAGDELHADLIVMSIALQE